MEKAQLGERQVTSTVWRKATVAGAVVGALGATAAIALVIGGSMSPSLAVIALVVVAGLALLGLGLVAPRSVQADPSGLRVGRGVSDRVVPWARVRRVRGNGQGMVQGDTHLELIDGGLVELPGGVRMGTVERWRQETGGALPPPESDDRRTWPVLRQAMFWPVCLYLPLVLNIFLDGWGLLLGLVLAAVVAAVLLRRRPPQVVATREGLSVPTWRGRRQVAWDDLAQVRGRADRWDFQQTAERADGTTLDLPIGLTSPLVEQWRTDLNRPLQD